MSAYTGTLVRLANSAQDRKLPAPSPRHAVDESDNAISQQQRTVPAGTGSEFGGTGWQPELLPGGGMQLDTPASWARDVDADPYRIKYAKDNPHDSRAVLTLREAEQPNGGRLRAHDGSQDHGYMRTRFTGAPLAGELDERDADRTDGYSNPFGVAGEADMTKYVRGLNSRPENNPDGFRVGVLQRWTWTGGAAKHITRDYGIQYTQPRDAYVAQPRQRMVKDVVTGVMLPRSAGSFDDAVMSGNDANAASTVGSSFGGF